MVFRWVGLVVGWVCDAVLFGRRLCHFGVGVVSTNRALVIRAVLWASLVTVRVGCVAHSFACVARFLWGRSGRTLEVRGRCLWLGCVVWGSSLELCAVAHAWC